MSSRQKDDFKFRAKIINAGSAGFIGISCVYPLNLLKFIVHNQRQTVNTQSSFQEVRDCAVHLFRSHGIRGFYNGFTVNALFITPEKTIKLVVNDYLRSKLKTKNESLSLYRQILAAAGAGTCQITVTVPMELLIIRKVTSTNQNLNIKIVSAREHALNAYRQNGFRGLYKGVTATWCRDVFFSVIYFPLFEYLNNRATSADRKNIPHYHTFMSGMIASTVAGYLATPFDVIKTRIQSSDNKNLYSGVIDCAKKILQSEQKKTFMKGALLRVMVIAPLFGIVQVVFFIGIGEGVLGIDK